MATYKNNLPLGIFFGTSSDTDPVQRHYDRWVEDAPPLADNISEGHIGSSFQSLQSKLLFIILSLLFTILIGRLVVLQIMQGNHYAGAAEGNRERVIPIPAERGIIYDRNGIALTRNIPNFSLALTPQDLPRSPVARRDVVTKLAEITNQPTRDVAALIDRFGNYSYESIILQEDIPYDTALKLLIASSDLPGIHIHQGSKRLYITDPTVDDDKQDGVSSLSHVIGYEAKLDPNELDTLYDKGYLPSDSIGKTGVEKSYETLLRGQYGKRRIEVDVLGKEQAALAEVAPEPGVHVHLSIDQAMQSKLESILADALEAGGFNRGAAIAMDPQSGEILSLVSLPTFNNNHFSGGIDAETYASYTSNEHNPLFNRAIGGTYPSGSTIKPAVAAAALEEGIITSQTAVLSSGGIRVGQWFFPDWLGGGHGMTHVRASLANSVNTFYYYIGGGYKEFEGLGVAKITQYLKRFGLSQPLAIDLPGEASGFLPSKKWKEEAKQERWYIGDTYNLSIGQGDLLVTPLQIASMTATVANGGTLYRPHVVRATQVPGAPQEEIQPVPVGKDIISPSHLRTIRLGMRDCVTNGSCTRLSLLPFAAAGKTGTAQWSSTKEPHAWFTSFAPFESPEIVVTILVEEGEGGSRTAAPIAHKFYDWWWQYRAGLAS